MKYISFFLPQFHEIPENNLWWGEGFTEWVNTKKSKPRWPGHWQPRVPLNKWYYDLTDPAVKYKQTEMAVKYGIDAFCFYHYWFNGKTVLNAPVKAFADADDLPLQFCLCWANENWTRAWDGLNREVLLKQEYSESDNIKHIEWLLDYLKNPRYYRIDNKPLLIIYNPSEIPSINKMLQSWRKIAAESGIEGLFICSVESVNNSFTETETFALGFDSIVGFHPSKKIIAEKFMLQNKLRGLKGRVNKIADRFKLTKSFRASTSLILDYSEYVKTAITSSHGKKYFPCVMPTWDNSARTKASTVIQNTEPKKFKEWLAFASNQADKNPENEKIVFINAWNEWAEGCHLEPDEKLGYSFLECVSQVKQKYL